MITKTDCQLTKIFLLGSPQCRLLADNAETRDWRGGLLKVVILSLSNVSSKCSYMPPSSPGDNTAQLFEGDLDDQTRWNQKKRL